MKKLSAFILILSVIITVFSACSDNDNSEVSRPTTPTTTMGEIANSYVHQQHGIDKTVIYETDNKETLKLEVYDEKGNLKRTEEYLYDKYGSLYGYSYYNKDGVSIGQYLFAGEKTGYFSEDGTALSENDFLKRFDALS